MRIEGFSEELIRRREEYLKLPIGLTSPEATSLVAVHAAEAALKGIEARGADHGTLTMLDKEITRRAELVYNSPAHKSAMRKLSGH